MALVLAACALAPTPDAGPPSSEPETGEPKPAEPEPGEAGPTAPEPSEPEPPEPKPSEPEPVEPQPATSKPAAPESTGPARPEPVQQPPTEFAVTGRLRMTGGAADPAEAVIYYVDRGRDAAPASGQPREIVTENKALRPTVMAVPRGTTMRFPNRDPILHNLFSVSSGNSFDLGVYGPGDAPATTLETPGVVNIYCNVHHDMHAHVLVLDTPYFARPDGQGRFELTGLPPGAGELHVWHRQADRWSRVLELPAGNPLAIDLEVTKPGLPPHRDKAGQSYQRRDRDPYR